MIRKVLWRSASPDPGPALTDLKIQLVFEAHRDAAHAQLVSQLLRSLFSDTDRSFTIETTPSAIDSTAPRFNLICSVTDRVQRDTGVREKSYKSSLSY